MFLLKCKGKANLHFDSVTESKPAIKTASHHCSADCIGSLFDSQCKMTAMTTESLMWPECKTVSTLCPELQSVIVSTYYLVHPKWTFPPTPVMNMIVSLLDTDCVQLSEGSMGLVGMPI